MFLMPKVQLVGGVGPSHTGGAPSHVVGRRLLARLCAIPPITPRSKETPSPTARTVRKGMLEG